MERTRSIQEDSNRPRTVAVGGAAQSQSSLPECVPSPTKGISEMACSKDCLLKTTFGEKLQ